MLAVTQELVASLPAAVAYLSGPDLVVDFANDACFELLAHGELLGRPLREVLPELAARGEVEVLSRILKTGEPVRGSKAPVLVTRHGQAEQRFVDYVFQPVRDAGGTVAGILLYAVDVTDHVRDRRELEEVVAEQRKMEAALRESAGLLGRLREANVLGVVSSTELAAYEANDAFLDIVGYSRDDLAAGRISYKSISAPQWAARDRRALEQMRRTGAFQPYDKEYVHRDGYLVPVLVGGAVIDWNPLRWVTFVVDLTAQRHAERQRAELLARERAALADAQSAGERLTFLMRAGALVAATRDRDELLDQVTQLVVPSLADCCMVFLPTADGKLRVSALTHGDPARTRKLAALREHPVPTAGPLMSQRAYTSGVTQLVRDVAAELPSWATVDPDATEIVASVYPRSALATPLLVGQRTLGVMVMYRGRGRPRFASTDTEVVEEIARRLAVGLANADTFAREHAIAETLQRSILPDTLPQIPGLDLAVRYLPATQGANVGGDWYDAFPVEGGRIALVIGDVAGHSIGSASGMGQVRSILRAYAIDHPDPGRVLRRTNTAVARLLPETLASVVYAVLDLGAGVLSYANAGHPPPVVVTGAGHAEYLDDATGTMLGACADTTFTLGRRRLSAGGGLLFYTDGLIEDRHRDLATGLVLLADTLRLSAPFSAEQMCAAVEASLLGSEHRADDVCLLAAQLTS